MKFLFVLSELPYPAHRNGVALINHQLLTRIPDGTTVDLLVAAEHDPACERALRQAAPRLGNVRYIEPATERRYRIGNLLSVAVLGRILFESAAAIQDRRQRWAAYDAVYVSPLMSFVDPTAHAPTFLNAVDSFARLNDVAARSHGRWRDRVKTALYRRYERSILPRVARVGFVSAADAAYVQRNIPGLAVACIPNGVDVGHFRPSTAPPDPHTVLFTGNFAYQPNAEAAIYFAREVMPRLMAIEPRARFDVAGKHPPPILSSLPGVKVSGFVDEIRDSYQQAAVFACPLLSGAGIKNKVLEAMACGLPVVTTSIGVDGIDGAVAGTHYVLAHSAAEFADAIASLWANPSRRASLSAAARQFVAERMDWSDVAARYFDGLRGVAAS